VQSTPMTTNPSTSDEQIKLATDLLASAMSGSVPPNWWGYGTPTEMMLKTHGTSRVAHMTGKAPMASAPPNLPMNQSPQYTTTTTARPYTGNSQAPTFQMPNASADSMLTQQRFMTQPGYVNSMMMPNFQPSAGFMPMNANNGWTGQLVLPQMPQQNHQAPGFQQGQVQPGFQNQGLANQPMNLGQLLGTALNAMVMIGMIDLIGSIRMMIGGLMGRLEGERQFMIGWGADSVYKIGLVIVLDIFPRTNKNLKKWPMHEFPMSSYFVETLILIGWSQGKVVAHRQGSHNFLHGV